MISEMVVNQNEGEQETLLSYSWAIIKVIRSVCILFLLSDPED